MLLTLKDVAKELQCTTRTIQYMVQRGEIAAIQVTERNIRVHPDDLETYIQSKQKEANEKCDQQRIKAQTDSNSGSMIQMVINNNSRQKRISQRILRKGKRT